VRSRLLHASAVLALGLATGGVALGHGGGLNAEGCHTNRKTGDYHCHRGGGRASSDERAPTRRLVPGRDSSRRGRGPFANCAEARAAGAAPVRRGDPGYGPHLDRDHDGVGCE
jgi:hypothetical protein